MLIEDLHGLFLDYMPLQLRPQANEIFAEGMQFRDEKKYPYKQVPASTNLIGYNTIAGQKIIDTLLIPELIKLPGIRLSRAKALCTYQISMSSPHQASYSWIYKIDLLMEDQEKFLERHKSMTDLNVVLSGESQKKGNTFDQQSIQALANWIEPWYIPGRSKDYYSSQ